MQNQYFRYSTYHLRGLTIFYIPFSRPKRGLVRLPHQFLRYLIRPWLSYCLAKIMSSVTFYVHRDESQRMIFIFFFRIILFFTPEVIYNKYRIFTSDKYLRRNSCIASISPPRCLSGYVVSNAVFFFCQRWNWRLALRLRSDKFGQVTVWAKEVMLLATHCIYAVALQLHCSCVGIALQKHCMQKAAMYLCRYNPHFRKKSTGTSIKTA